MALTHEEIANMAGTSRETVTRLLNQFRRDQWITIKGTSMTIVKPDQLERLTAYPLLFRNSFRHSPANKRHEAVMSQRWIASGSASEPAGRPAARAG